RRRPPTSPLFPYTTLFRSEQAPFRRKRVAGTFATARQARNRRMKLSFSTFTVVLAAIAAAGLEAAEPVAGATAPDFVLKSVAGKDRKSTRLNSSHVKISYA